MSHAHSVNGIMQTCKSVIGILQMTLTACLMYLLEAVFSDPLNSLFSWLMSLTIELLVELDDECLSTGCIQVVLELLRLTNS